MERETKRDEHEHGGERIKTAREILEERLAQMKTDEAAAEALRKAAERAPAGAGEQPGAAEKPAPAPAEIPAAEIEQLRKKAAERDELFDQLLRARAEFDNYQKRVQRETAEYRDFALAGVMNDILLAIDTLDMAFRAGGDSKEVQAIKAGVDMVRQQLEKVLTDRGATRIPTEGAFDPRRHEAVLTEERSDLPPNTITGELRRGYLFKDRVIRAAQVKVSRAPEGGPSGARAS
jgi:molecular chaperone GrpE